MEPQLPLEDDPSSMMYPCVSFPSLPVSFSQPLTLVLGSFQNKLPAYHASPAKIKGKGEECCSLMLLSLLSPERQI